MSRMFGWHYRFEDLRISYIFKGNFVSSAFGVGDFQNALSIFLNIFIAAWKNLQNLKLKLFILSLCFKEKDKIKETKQKDENWFMNF